MNAALLSKVAVNNKQSSAKISKCACANYSNNCFTTSMQISGGKYAGKLVNNPVEDSDWLRERERAGLVWSDRFEAAW